MLRVFREDIKEGHSAAHERVETGYVRAFQKADYPSYTAYESLSGPYHVDFVEAYDSYAALESTMHLSEKDPLKSAISALDALDGEHRSGSRSFIATYHPELSYRPEASPGPKARYASVVTIQIRPGRAPEFIELTKNLNAARAKTGLQRGYMVYAVNSGMPAGTYIAASLLESLKSLDTTGSMTIQEAFGPQAYAQYEKTLSEIVVSNETTLYSVSAKMSNPSKETVASDPSFWAPKPKPAATAAAKPAGAKSDNK